MSVPEIWPEGCDFLPGQPILFANTDSQLSPFGGLLLFRQLDHHLGLTRDFASDLCDTRNPNFVRHTYLDMVRQRVYGILADHEDQNDADTLRNDPIFQLLLERQPDDLPLASQPTLSRFENAIDIQSLFRFRERFVQQFLEAFSTPPRHLTAELLPGATYDEYVGRGESENRHKEFKCEMHMGRLSNHRFVANFFRLYLHALALNLLVRLRRLIALPPDMGAAGGPSSVPEIGSACASPNVGSHTNSGVDSDGYTGVCSGVAMGVVFLGSDSAVGMLPDVPAEAATGAARASQFRARRRRDVLGEGQPSTWRRLVIGMTVRIRVQAEGAVLVELSSSWPHGPLFRDALRRLLQALPGSAGGPDREPNPAGLPNAVAHGQHAGSRQPPDCRPNGE